MAFSTIPKTQKNVNKTHSNLDFITKSDLHSYLGYFLLDQKVRHNNSFIFDSEPHKDVCYVDTITSINKTFPYVQAGFTLAAKLPSVSFGHAYAASFKSPESVVKLVAGADYNSQNIQDYSKSYIDLQSKTFFDAKDAPKYSQSYEETHRYFKQIAQKTSPFVGSILYATHNEDNWRFALTLENSPKIAVLYGAHTKLKTFVKQHPAVRGYVYIPVGKPNQDNGFYTSRRFTEMIAPKSGLRDALIDSESRKANLLGNACQLLSKLSISETNKNHLGNLVTPVAKYIENDLFLVHPNDLDAAIANIQEAGLHPYINFLMKENATYDECVENLHFLESKTNSFTDTLFALKPSTILYSS